jgi:type I restriction enzyme, S subunit
MHSDPSGAAVRWKEVSLGDVADDVTVGFVGPMAHRYVDSGIPFLRSQNIAPYRIDLSDVKWIPEDFHGELKKSELTPGTVVIVRTGKPGTAAVVPNDFPKANCADLVLVRPSKALDPRFLCYFLNSAVAQNHIDAHVVGAVQQHFNVAEAKRLRLLLPSIAEQHAIVRVLGTLDEKRELLRRMNATLEAIADATFKSWFTDFDPVRAKREGRRPDGMDDETAAGFTTELQESALGLIPAGWQVEPLDSVANFLNGLALQNFPAEGPASLPVIKIADLRRGDTLGSDRASLNVPANYVIGDGDILFSWSGSLTVVMWCGGPGALNQHLFKVTSERFPRWLFHRWVLQHLPEFQAIAAGKATTMGHIQRGHLTRALVAVPPPDLLKRVSPLFERLEAQWIANNMQMRTLRSLRDGLLPKLMSGELSAVPTRQRET